jgi:class 3 adenylate cyclase/tetratricopeptide (TPR) repeat protein
LHQYGQGKLRGSLRAYVLSFDIVDFTSIADNLTKSGNKGAEEISRLLTCVLEKPLDLVSKHGGFITNFDGDAFWAVFPQADPRQTLAVALLIRNHFRKHKSYTAGSGRVGIKVRLGLGYGRINWRIFTNPHQNEYVFTGRAFDVLDRHSGINRELFITSEVRRILRDRNLADNSGNIMPGFHPGKVRGRVVEYPHDASLALSFIHSRFHNLNPNNEIRRVVCNFSILRLDSLESLNEIIPILELVAATVGGYVNKISIRGDQFKSLIFYGSPRNEGITMDKTSRMAVEAWTLYPDLKHGISIGSLFTGYIGNSQVSEFTVIGHSVNLAARLAEKAAFGEILTDAAAKEELKFQYSFEEVENPALKGILSISPIYRYVGSAQASTECRQAGFVGRKAELKMIARHLDRALERRANCVIYVSGEPGIGKTRLLEEVASRIDIADWQTFNLYCDPIPTHLLKPIKQLFQKIIGFDPGLAGPEAAEQFQRAFSAWAGKDGADLAHMSFIGSIFGFAWEGSPRENTPTEMRKQRGHEAGLAVLKAQCARKPMLVILDDLQWLDGQTQDFLQYIGNSEIHGLCLLTSTRYLEDGSIPDLRLRNFHSLHIDLQPLSPADMVRLHKELLGLAHLPKATIDRIRQRSTGNPFLIEQVVSYYVEQGRVNPRGEVVDPLKKSTATYNMEEIIGHRIDRLSDSVRTCLYNASVLGLRFNMKVLSIMLGYDPGEDLDNGTQNHIWKKVDEDIYAFSHILIQSTAYSRMMTERLRELHLRAASSMAALYGPLPNEHSEEIAGHYELAGALAEAAEHCDLAMDHYWDNSYFERSEAASRKAVKLGLKAYGKSNMKYGEKVFHLALLYHYLLRYKEAEPLYLEVVRIAGKTHGLRNSLMSPYLNNLGRFYKDIGRYPESETYLRRSLGFERKTCPNTSNEADRINNIGHLYIKQGLWDKAEKMMLKAYEIMEKNHDPDHWFMAAVCNNLGGVYLEQGKLDLSEQLLLRAVAISEKARGKEHPVTAIYLKNLGNTYMKKGRLTEAESLYLRSLDIYSRSFGRMHQNTLIVVESLKQLYGLMQNEELQQLYSDWLAKGSLNKEN